MNFKSASRCLMLAMAGSAMAMPAMAQWQWVDKDGRKVFSDRAPPIDVAPQNILKQPASKAASPAPGTDLGGTAAPAAATPASAPAARASAPRLAGKDAQLEMRKKQADELEAARKQAEEERLAAARADSCERARKGQAMLNSGARIPTTNARGERDYLDDAARAAEVKRLQAIADSECGR